MVLYSSGLVDPQLLTREVYYEQTTFRCDHWCAETWRTLGEIVPDIILGGAAGVVCYRSRGTECDAEAIAHLLYASGDWQMAEHNYYQHLGDAPYYPYSEYPLGE